MASSPDLPLDVARLLLEEAAWADRFTTARNLTLVSKVVRQWIDPILHHTVTLNTFTKLYAFAATVIARNDPDFFRGTVKVLIISDKLESGDVPAENTIKLAASMTVVLTACAGIERFGFWIAAQIPFQLLQKDLRPTHVSLIPGRQVDSLSLLFTVISPSLTHLHLNFASFASDLHLFNGALIWPGVFARCSRLTHLLFSGHAFETMKPHDFHRAIDPIVSVLRRTVTSVIVSVIPLRAHADSAPIPIQLKTLQADPRVVFILPTEHPLHVVEELTPHEKNRDGCLNWGSRDDVDCEEFLAVDVLISVFA